MCCSTSDVREGKNHEKLQRHRFKSDFSPDFARRKRRRQFSSVAARDGCECDNKSHPGLRQIPISGDQRSQLRLLQALHGAVGLHVRPGAHYIRLFLLDLAQQDRLTGKELKSRGWGSRRSACKYGGGFHSTRGVERVAPSAPDAFVGQGHGSSLTSNGLRVRRNLGQTANERFHDRDCGRAPCLLRKKCFGSMKRFAFASMIFFVCCAEKADETIDDLNLVAERILKMYG